MSNYGCQQKLMSPDLNLKVAQPNLTNDSLPLIIIRKVAVKLGLNLSGISSGDLIAPLKVQLWTLQESSRF